VHKYGMVVISRAGNCPEKFIYESDVLTKHKVFCFYSACIVIMSKFFAHSCIFNIIWIMSHLAFRAIEVLCSVCVIKVIYAKSLIFLKMG